MNNIIITLTTIPSRLNSDYNYNMQNCIESLLNQTYTGDYQIHINIPNIYTKTEEKYTIPKWLKQIKDPRLKIYRTKDYGSITKLIPTLRRTKVSDKSIIIVVDDDIIYHSELITEHIKNRNLWPNYAVGYDGLRSRNIDGKLANNFNTDSRDYYFSATGSNSLVDILQHYKSISYVRSFFKPDFYAFIKKYSTWCDDTTVAAYLAKSGIGRLCTFFDDDEIFESFEDYVQNVSQTFPILKHTEHDRDEGCFLEREKNDEIVNKRHTMLFTEFIDNGYTDKIWTI